MNEKIIILDTSSKEDYMELYKLPPYSVFKYRGNYETVMRRIEEYTPENATFKVFPINPGTDLYTMYGPDHLVVIENSIKD